MEIDAMEKINCPSCQGSGEFDNGYGSYQKCWHCDGTGELEVEVDTDGEE